jgi:DNA-binding transcriptional MerR regulator
MTMAQIRALAAQKGQQHQAKAQAALSQANAAFEQHRAQLEQQHQAKLQADNGKAMADFKRLP